MVKYATSPQEIARKFKLAEKRVKEVFEKSTREALIQMFSNIITLTPVLTGRLRSNWQAQNNTMPIDIIDSTERDPIPPMTKEFNAYRIGTTAYFVNNLPYAARIEYHGWSKDKRPEGMITPQLPNWKPLLEAAVKLNVQAEGTKNV